MSICEVCDERETVHVLSVPGLPYSAGYCEECAKSGANPYWCMVTVAAMCEGIEHVSAEYLSIIEVTLKYLDKTWEEFNEAVEVDIKGMADEHSTR